MALPAPVQAIYDRLKSLYNGGAYNPTRNPGGFARGGNQQGVFIAAMRDFADFGKVVVDASVSAMDDAQATAADRVATGQDRQAAAASAGNAAGSAQAAAASAATVDGPLIDNRLDALEAAARKDRLYSFDLMYGS